MLRLIDIPRPCHHMMLRAYLSNVVRLCPLFQRMTAAHNLHRNDILGLRGHDRTAEMPTPSDYGMPMYRCVVCAIDTSLVKKWIVNFSLTLVYGTRGRGTVRANPSRLTILVEPCNLSVCRNERVQ